MSGDQRPDRVRRLRVLLDPEVHALLVDLHDRRLAARIVMSKDFDERAVARGARIGDHDAEERALLRSGPTQTNGNHLSLLNAPEARSPCASSLRNVVERRETERTGSQTETRSNRDD